MILRKPRTLLWQLGSALMIVQALAILLLGWYAFDRFKQFNQDQSTAELKRATNLLAARYSMLIAGEGAPAIDPGIQATLEEDGRRTGLRITLVAADGTVLADSDHQPAELDNH